MGISWGNPRNGARTSKNAAKKGGSRDNRSPMRPSGSSPGRWNAATSRKWPKTRGPVSIGRAPFECAKRFDSLLSLAVGLGDGEVGPGGQGVDVGSGVVGRVGVGRP